MEIDVTDLMKRGEDNDLYHYSASRAELGDDAGQITWQNSLDMFDDDNLDRMPDFVAGDDIESTKEYFAKFGAWEREEIDSWSSEEVNAILLQFIAGRIREYISTDDKEHWAENYGGDLSRGDDDRWYFYVGH